MCYPADASPYMRNTATARAASSALKHSRSNTMLCREGSESVQGYMQSPSRITVRQVRANLQQCHPAIKALRHCAIG